MILGHGLYSRAVQQATLSWEIKHSPPQASGCLIELGHWSGSITLVLRDKILMRIGHIPTVAPLKTSMISSAPKMPCAYWQSVLTAQPINQPSDGTGVGQHVAAIHIVAHMLSLFIHQAHLPVIPRQVLIIRLQIAGALGICTLASLTTL